MKEKRFDCILLGGSVVCFFLMSVSFLLMMADALAVFAGILLWAGFLGGVTLQILLEIRRRAFFRAYRVRREKMQKPRNGLLTFFSNREGKIADITMIAGIPLTVLVFILTKGYGVWCFLFVALTVFSFCLHCIFNGRIYFHVKNQNKVRQALDQRDKKGKDEGRKCVQ